MASEDPLSQSTVWDDIHGDYYCCVTVDNLTEDNEVYVVLYYPLYNGCDFLEYPFLFKKPNKVACWAQLAICLGREETSFSNITT